ncbi:MAG TPA: glycosyltransferase family 4 protein [bacterium]|nr:glycosyltransferase family 4 protein [bacterium]
MADAAPVPTRRAAPVGAAYGGGDDAGRPAVAFLPWGNVIEDFTDTIGVSLESFCDWFTGSYMFRYVEALQRAGVRTVLICMTTRVTRAMRVTHRPSNATVYFLPAPKIYRFLQRIMGGPSGPYRRSVREAFGEIRGIRLLLMPVLTVLKELALYLTTPPLTLAGVLRRERCAAVLCQEYEYPRFDVCVALGRVMRVPVFATFQGGDYQRSRIERVVRPFSMRACAGLIVAPRAEIRRVQDRYHVPERKLARIFTPIDRDIWCAEDRRDARAALGLPLSAGVVVWHGRISIWPKGLDLLLDAWTQVCRTRPGRALRLILVGTGQDAAEFRRRAATAVEGTVWWINEFVHDRRVIRRYLSAADVYAFPSRHEGFPVAPLEAMSCGLPIVAAKVKGIPDILEGGEAAGGLVVPPGDPQQLAAAIGRLLDDEGARRELGQRARRRIEAAFSLNTVGLALRAFLIEGRHPGEAAESGDVGADGCNGKARDGGA